jgi:hypothetical protein
MPISNSSSVARSGKRGGGGATASPNADLSNPNFFLPFFIYLTVPASTSQDSPQETNFELPIGWLDRIWCEFPRGCSGLVGFQVWRGPYQVFPLPDGTWLRSDNSVVNFALSRDFTREPYNVTVKVYNSDNTYSHTIWIGFEMRGKPGDLPPKLQSFISSLTG